MPVAKTRRALASAMASLVLTIGGAGALAQARQAPDAEPLPGAEPFQGAEPLPGESAEPIQSPFVEAAPPDEERREGFLLGGSLGFGSLDAEGQSNSTTNYHVELGGFLNPEWAVAVAFWGGIHNANFVSISNNNAGLTGQYWIRDTFWLKGLLGKADLTVAYDGVRVRDFAGMAIGGMAGWDFYQRGSYYVQASLGFTVEGYEDAAENVTATAIQLGIQYY